MENWSKWEGRNSSYNEYTDSCSCRVCLFLPWIDGPGLFLTFASLAICFPLLDFSPLIWASCSYVLGDFFPLIWAFCSYVLGFMYLFLLEYITMPGTFNYNVLAQCSLPSTLRRHYRTIGSFGRTTSFGGAKSGILTNPAPICHVSIWILPYWYGRCIPWSLGLRSHLPGKFWNDEKISICAAIWDVSSLILRTGWYSRCIYALRLRLSARSTQWHSLHRSDMWERYVRQGMCDFCLVIGSGTLNSELKCSSKSLSGIPSVVSCNEGK